MKKMVLSALLALGLWGAAAVSHAQALNTVLVATGLTQPLFATSPVPGGPLYVVEKGGLIKAVQGGTTTNFLQISVGTSGERGLLGLAFDPNYAVVGAPGFGRLFVDYIDPSRSRTRRSSPATAPTATRWRPTRRAGSRSCASTSRPG
jgi:hypothetical protein